MKKYLFILLFTLLVSFSEKECKGPDGDSKPTPFRKDNFTANENKYIFLIDIDGAIYSIILFLSISIPISYIINKK